MCQSLYDLLILLNIGDSKYTLSVESKFWSVFKIIH